MFKKKRLKAATAMTMTITNTCKQMRKSGGGESGGYEGKMLEEKEEAMNENDTHTDQTRRQRNRKMSVIKEQHCANKRQDEKENNRAVANFLYF